jgi:hypothetical protein
MWGELPKLFGKAFAIGFFLPSAATLLAFLGVFLAFGDYGVTTQLANKVTSEWIGATISIFILWMGGVTLMALNRPIIRFFEGDYRFNPLRFLLFSKTRRFARIDKEILDLRRERDAAALNGTAWPSDRAARYGKLMEEYSEYPNALAHILPTKFGNAIRSFEVYSRIIYGLEAIDGWPRLLAVIPADYRQAIDDAKAQVDFWVNIWLGSLLVAVLYGALSGTKGTVPMLWIPVVALVIAFGAARGARALVGEWGALVMSAFDLFRGDLCKKMGLKMPPTIGEEREMWTLMSQVMGYRSREVADRLSRFRDAGGGPASR